MRDRFTLLVAASLTCSGLVLAPLPRLGRAALSAPEFIAQAEEAPPETAPADNGKGGETTPVEAAAPEATPTDGDEGGEAADEGPALRVGDRGPEVRELQMRLERLKLYQGEVTGEYDEATATAVRNFQAANDLEATGVFNVETWRKLDAAQNPRRQQQQRGGLFRMSRKRALVLIGGGGLITLLGGFGAILLLLRFINSSQAVEPEEPEASEASLPVEADHFEDAIAPSPDGMSADEPEPALSNDSPVPEPDPWPTGMPPVRSTAVPPGVTYPPRPRPEVAPEPRPLDKPLVGAPEPFTAKAEPPPWSPEPPNGSPAINESLTPLEPPPALTRLDRVDELIRELREPDADQRQQAIWELAQQADSRAVQPLVNLLLDSDSQQQSLILEALSQIGTRALKPMNRALALSLQDDDAHVRKNAIRDLTRIYELVAQLSQLLYYATDDPDPGVQETARWALGQLNNIRMPNAMASGDRAAPPN